MSCTKEEHTDSGQCQCIDCMCNALNDALHEDSLCRHNDRFSTNDACSSCESEYYCVCDMLVEHGHCSDCLYVVCRCDEYEWEDYSRFNNCMTGDCKECTGLQLQRGGFCPMCYEKECMCDTVPANVVSEFTGCTVCESTHCICEMLDMHGYSKSL